MVKKKWTRVYYFNAAYVYPYRPWGRTLFPHTTPPRSLVLRMIILYWIWDNGVCNVFH